jgi:hypothetical protein
MILQIVGIVLSVGAAFFAGYRLPNKETSALKAKLKKVTLEVDNIEKSAEARLRIQIHQVTARIKSLL